jgi:hypothetical protein
LKPRRFSVYQTTIRFGLILALLGVTGLITVWFSKNHPDGVPVFDSKPRQSVKKRARGPLRTLTLARKANLLPVTAPVVINEIGRADPSHFTDLWGIPSDWIELYNRSEHAVNLRGYSLSDDPQNPRKWTFPDIILPAQDYLLLRAAPRNDLLSPICADANDARGRPPWQKITHANASLAGSVWRYQSSLPDKPDDQTGRLVYDINVPHSDSYNLWLRCAVPEETAAKVLCEVDDRSEHSLTIPHSKHLRIIRLCNPETPDGSWTLKHGLHRIKITGLMGVLLCDHVSLTPVDGRFGDGSQSLLARIGLKQSGELLMLYSRERLPLDYITFPALEPGQAYTRIPDGGPDLAIANPSPLGQDVTPTPSLSLPNGLVSSGSLLRIEAATPDDQIFYTLDGTTPTTDDTPYTAPLVLNEPTAIRARAFRDGLHPSRTETRVYWPGKAPTIPLMWIVLDPNSLRGGHRGMLSHPMMRGRLSEHTAFACLLYPDGHTETNTCAIRIQGRSTRWLVARKSFRLKFRPDFGADRWPGTPFEEPGPTNHSSLVVNGGKTLYSMMGLDILRAARFVTPRCRNVLLRFNDENFGIHSLLDDPNDEEFLRFHYGHLDLDVVKTKTANMVKQGTREQFDKDWGIMYTDAYHAKSADDFKQMIDPAYFIRWVATLHFLSLGDNAQGYFVRDLRDNPDQWTFINWDTDAALQLTVEETPGFQNIEKERGRLFMKLLPDPECREIYVREAQALLNHPCQTNRWLEQINRYASELEPYIRDDYQGRKNEDRHLVKGQTPDSIYSNYQFAVSECLRFIREQHPQLRDAITEEFELDAPFPVEVTAENGPADLLIDGWPETTPYRGLYYPGTHLTLQATNSIDTTPVFLINNQPVARGSLDLPITTDTQITVRFEDFN